MEREKVRLEKRTNGRSSVPKQAGGHRGKAPSAMATGGQAARQGYWGLRKNGVTARSVGHRAHAFPAKEDWTRRDRPLLDPGRSWM